jgi:hypothetical protein
VRGPEGVSETYGRILLIKKMGYPLWIPEPSNIAKKYGVEGVSIGDLGVLTYDGRFNFLFNICLPKDHPVNRHAPPGFVPIDFDKARDVEVIPDFHPRDCLMKTQTMLRRPLRSDNGFVSTLLVISPPSF